jgi:hypothetical protein
MATVRNLFEATRRRRLAERNEKHLKALIMQKYPKGTTQELGDFVLSAAPDERETLDRAALEDAYGLDALTPFLKKHPIRPADFSNPVQDAAIRRPRGWCKSACKTQRRP